MNLKKEAKEIIACTITIEDAYMMLTAYTNSIIEILDEPGINISDIRELLLNLKEEIE